jgi:hypothetical protein
MILRFFMVHAAMVARAKFCFQCEDEHVRSVQDAGMTERETGDGRRLTGLACLIYLNH